MIQKHLGIGIIFLMIAIPLKSQTLSALTYNIRYDTASDSLNRWENRKDFLISQLRFYEPDVFGTQEGLVNQLRDIENGLPDYDFIGVGRDTGADAGEHTAIFYNVKKLKLIEQNTFWLSQTPEKPSRGWDAALNRICTYALLQTKENHLKFWVFNTHFDHVGEQARRESSKLILKKIERINKKHFPVILMGDLNLEPDHSGIQALFDEMDDTYSLAGFNTFGPVGTFNGFNFLEQATRRIDYIFTSIHDFHILKYGVLSGSIEGRYPSDHFPVYVEMSRIE